MSSPLRVEVINTGSELLLGFTVNTHAGYLGRKLADYGLRIVRQTTIGDDRAEMKATVTEALGRSDILLITGGLGPTSDDFTRDAVAELLGRQLVRDETVAGQIGERFRRRGMRMPEQVLVQAQVPVGATVLANPNGTAPGLVIEEKGKLIVLLPGPPRELKPMFEQLVIPLIQKTVGAMQPFDCRVFKVVRLAESIVEEKIAPVLADVPNLELGYCARMGEIEVRIIAATAIADEAEQRIRAALGDSIFGTGDVRLEEVVIKMLADASQTVATAESCTGGLIANRLTNVSGSSAAFINGFVTYSNESKQRLLGVSPETLDCYGAVSLETAREMAEGARQRSGVDFAISVTGIAGPTGGTAEKPVGLVFIGLASAKHTLVERHNFLLDRETFKHIVSQFAIDMVRRELLPVMIRAFIAIAIPAELRASIQNMQTRLKQSRLGVKVSWAKIDNLHLTLQFLGEIEAARLAIVRTALEGVAANHQSMELTVAGVGAFPGDRRPHILWVGCEDETGQLKGLAQAIQQALAPLGFRVEHRDYAAHLTIGRITIPRKDAALTRALDSIKKERFGKLRVEEFHLMQSQLHPEGSIYTKLSSHRLTGDTDHVVKS